MLSNPLARKTGSHTWRFFRAGGFDQVRLDSGADLASLDQLDQKLWVALGCPTRGIEFDTKTLDLIDTDKDGRIRAPEIIAAAQWACAMLKDPAHLLKSADALPLDAISDVTPEGKQLLASARQILINLGKPEAAAITIDDTTDLGRIFAQTNFNGDGIIPIDAADDAPTRALIADIIECIGSEPDRSTKPGISQPSADRFFLEAQAYADWWAKTDGEAGIMILGEGTTAAAAAYRNLRTKVDDYFARCRLAAFDSRATRALNREESDYLALAAKDLTITSSELAIFPLARVEPNQPLPLTQNLNPAWADAVAAFRNAAVTPLLGDRTALSESDWSTISARFAAYEAWNAAKAGATVEKLGLPRVRTILGGNGKEAIAALIAKDKALEPEANAIASVDRLARYSRDLFILLQNFVSFRHFYRRKEKAIFQAGTLYLDQRSCDLCIRVDDMARHAAMAHLSYTYLAYCDLTRKTTNEKMTVAAAFTGGDSDNLMVGRNGIFYDRQGHDWDATIVKIVDNPISIRQAFWAPYKRVLRWIEDQIAKRAAVADADAQTRLTTAAEAAGKAATTGATPAAPLKLDIGVVAALGVAVGGITGAMGVLLAAFFGLGIWMPLGVIALLLLISGPSMVIAWLKLRQRNLGPILDANGWAVNAKARINIPFGRALTGVAVLPPNSKHDMIDEYAESHAWRYRLTAIVVAIVVVAGLWYFGAIERVLPGVTPKSAWLLRHEEVALKRTQEQAPKPAPTTAP